MAVENDNSTTPVKEKDLAQTPWWFIKSLESHLGKRITLDVCAQPDTAKAENFYSLEEGLNAMDRNWYEDGIDCLGVSDNELKPYPICYCNPPFSDVTTWILKSLSEVANGCEVWMMIPNNPETEYVRLAKSEATFIIEMPFRLRFLKPDGSEFSGKNGKPQGPKFSCLIAVFRPSRMKERTFYYHDFREGFYANGRALDV